MLDKTLQVYDLSIEQCTGFKVDKFMDFIISAVQENILSSSGNSINKFAA